MKKDTLPLTSLTLEELLLKKKKLKSIFITLGSFMLIASIMLFYLAFKTKNYALIAVAISCPWAFLPAWMSISAIDKEIQSRNV